jgi:hypothetical protein
VLQSGTSTTSPATTTTAALTVPPAQSSLLKAQELLLGVQEKLTLLLDSNTTSSNENNPSLNEPTVTLLNNLSSVLISLGKNYCLVFSLNLITRVQPLTNDLTFISYVIKTSYQNELQTAENDGTLSLC